MFKKILIANRAEIALRVVKTCKEMGIPCVTLYTDIEKDYPHSSAGDESVCLGDGALSETYLNQELLIRIAKDLGADAIHPGYGLLSENSEFAKKLIENKITLIGPRAETMLLMGDKKASKIEMERIGVPTIPGYHGDNQESQFLLEKAKEVGLPLMIKASAGGGGKGMRVVRSFDNFLESLESAKSEALKSFSDETVLIERFIENPRHIEVQVMSDNHGNHLHFFERECSIQRRHQKIIEESPSPALSEDLRSRICCAAVMITKEINYSGAGTVEFILDDKGEFFFLEMNTRLQVEHPITEMVTGSDLVRYQIEVAAGKKISILQDQITQRGHAIEVRIYAEDPDNNFMPSIGKIWDVARTDLNNVRFDNGFVAGNDVTINFDPMLSKLIVLSDDRQSAILKMTHCLNEVAYLGFKTNREYLQRVLHCVPFKKGDITTNFISDYSEQLQKEELTQESIAKAIAAFFYQKRNSVSTANSLDSRPAVTNPWNYLKNFRNI